MFQLFQLIGASFLFALADYEMVTLEPLPYRELGFPTVEAFMQSVADVVIISK